VGGGGLGLEGLCYGTFIHIILVTDTHRVKWLTFARFLAIYENTQLHFAIIAATCIDFRGHNFCINSINALCCNCSKHNFVRLLTYEKKIRNLCQIVI
jgi:hypothetical protein